MRISVPSILIGLALLAPMAAHAQLLTDFDGNGAFAAGSTVFRTPNVSGTTSAKLQASPLTTAISSDYAVSGANSLKVAFAFKDTEPAPWLRLTTFATPGSPNPVIDLNSTLAASVLIVPADPLVGGNNDLSFSLGVRETNSTGAIGSNGGTSGQIEYVGATSKVGGAPFGTTVSADGQWHDINFVMTGNGMTLATNGLTGNGILETTSGLGVLESFLITPIASTGQAYTIYFDNIRQIPNGNGGAIPEPGSMALLATGILPILGLRRRKK